MRLLPSVFLTLLGAIAVQGQVTSSNSSERIIVAAVFNSSLCQTDQFEIQQFVSGQCSQLGAHTVWFMCNETDPQNPMVMTRSFSSAAECASALSGGQMAGAAEGTYIDFCSAVGSDMALNFIACTDSAHLTQSIQRSTSLSVLTKDPAITFEYYAWNRPYCEGEPDDQHVIRFVYECSNYADYWGPAAPFCTDRSIVWPSYIDDQCTQVNTSVPFAVDPTGICFTAGNSSFIYGPCQSSFTYSGIDSLPAARDIAELVTELTPSTSADNFGVAPPTDPAQAVAVQQYMDAQCRTKNASEGAYSDLPLATCFASPALPDRGIQLYCTPAGVVGLTFQDSNCSTHHRTSQLWRFENCVNSAYLDTAIAVSTCSAGTIPTSL